MTASSLGRSAMDTHLIENIIKIAEEKSITKAAEKLYLTQSALNQQLLKIERELGTALFRRTKTEMIPTQAGESTSRAHGRCSAQRAGLMRKSAILREAIKGPYPLE